MKKMKLRSIIIFSLIIGGISFPTNVNAQQTASSEETTKDFKAELMWKAKVKIAGVKVIGESKYGRRQVIPITGGTFEGPKIKGEVLPAGEDWQLVRPDGDTELNARYMLKTSDGYILQIINRVLIHMPKPGEEGTPYNKSVIDIEAPIKSPYDYLNHAIFIGTMEMPSLKQGEESSVIIGVYKLL